ncbi:MAG: hypothetical protein NE327_17330 [Lentisphaeraceae bacterium]|nr:hypothetical protein [Lentisphaeraceae bacterium]
MFTSKTFLINILILFGSLSVLIYNYSVLHEINFLTNELNIIVENVEKKEEKIKHYHEYEKALKVSGFEHAELVD